MQSFLSSILERRGIPGLGGAVFTGALTLTLTLLLSCSHDSAESAGDLGCSPASPPLLLASKSDDDDGDGNVRDEDFPTINDEDDDIADHAWIRDEAGRFHLFFQNEGLFGPNQIEHYISTDLRTLEYAGLALEAVPGTWDEGGLWAPHVIRSGGVYYLFYTGIDATSPIPRQRIGVATSTDLNYWTRLPVNRCPGSNGDGCIYDCSSTWTTWGDPADAFNDQCRDPFVLRDETRDCWVMFATARSTNGYGVVTVARSTDLTHWSGAGFIDATRRLPTGIGGQTTGGMAENPHIFSRGPLHLLLFTDWRDPEDDAAEPAPRTIVQYATSPTLDADSVGSANWTYRGYIPDSGVNAIEVFRYGDHTIMSQSISNGHAPEHPEHRRELRLKCIIWRGSFDFDTYNVFFRDSDPSAGPPLGVGAPGGRTWR